LSIVAWVAAGGVSLRRGVRHCTHRRRALEICHEHGFADYLVLDNNRTFRRTIRWTGVLQAELGYRTRVIGQVRCTDVRQPKS
jgi:hypothetical protein